MQSLSGSLRRFAGFGPNSSSHLEKWISGAGGLSGILGVLLISQAYLGLSGSASLVASMGASAVLLFAVPHGPLSQPWAVFGGHLVSATIGVGCASLHADPLIASALAVALAISAMHYLRCIHPPGGATALTAVAGGESVHTMGFHFVLTPVLLNVLVILLVAMLFNIPFPWRRYPAIWAQHRSRLSPVHGGAQPADTAADEGSSLAGGSTTADRAAEPGSLQPAAIRAGKDYCNGAFGPDWQVRRVIDCQPETDNAGEVVSYRVVAGNRRRLTGNTSREDFAGWARYEVCRIENAWLRAQPAFRPGAVNTSDTNRMHRRTA